MAKGIDLNDIRLLVQVVEHGSFTAASRAVGVPVSTISQRIAGLERAIGTGLLRRTSRSLSLTEAGRSLLPHARAIQGLAEQIEQQLSNQSNGLVGTLRIACSNVLGQFGLSLLVPSFLSRHEGVTLQVEASNRQVDLISEGYDIAVRGHVGALANSTLLQRVIARTAWSLAASPHWIGMHGCPCSPEDIRTDQMLCFTGVPEKTTILLRSGQQEVSIQMRPRLVSDDMITLRDAATAGTGITCLPNYVMAPSIREGHLVTILPDWSPPSSSVSVLTPPKAQSSRLTQAFSDFLAAEIPRVLG